MHEVTTSRMAAANPKSSLSSSFSASGMPNNSCKSKLVIVIDERLHRARRVGEVDEAVGQKLQHTALNHERKRSLVQLEPVQCAVASENSTLLVCLGCRQHHVRRAANKREFRVRSVSRQVNVLQQPRATATRELDERFTLHNTSVRAVCVMAGN